jgi:hypothetical protein
MVTATSTFDKTAETEMKCACPRRATVWLAAGVWTCAFLAQETPARANDAVTDCIAANERSIRLRKEGKLIDARRELLACAAPTCPEVIQQACSGRMEGINAAMPSVVFDVKDRKGRSLTGVLVSIDDQAPVPLGATSTPLDPGTHTLRFETEGQSPVEKRVSLLEGDTDKRVTVVVGWNDVKMPRLVVSADEAATVVVDGQAAERGTFNGPLAVGTHDVQVTEAGKTTYETQVDLREGETRSMSITLHDAHGAPLWPWIVGGAAVAAGAIVGGYLLFSKPHDTTQGLPRGTIAVNFMSWRRP